MPVKLPDNFIKERYEQDQRYIFIYDTYTPNYNRPIITAKFYSKYEASTDEVDPVKLEKLKQAKDRGPKEKRTWPETSNQSYGWFCTPLVELDRNDSRLYYPRNASEMTKHQIRLLLSGVGKRK